MKFVLLFSIMLCLICFPACQEAKTSSVEPNGNSASQSTKNATFNNSSSATLSETPDDAINAPNIGVFYLTLSPFRSSQKKLKKQHFGLWRGDFNSFFGWAKIKEGLEFDIINQYGFLGKGRVLEFVKSINDPPGFWKAEVITTSLRNDLNKLANTRMGELEAELPSIPAIGVFPSKPERKNIWSGAKIDSGKKAMSKRATVFLSLPEEIKDNAEVYGQKGNLEYPNSWADLDGNGKIDYVFIRVRCKKKPRSHCEKNLFLHNGKWVDLPKRIAKER